MRVEKQKNSDCIEGIVLFSSARIHDIKQNCVESQ